MQGRSTHAGKEQACREGAGMQGWSRHAGEEQACREGAGMQGRSRHAGKEQALEKRAVRLVGWLVGWLVVRRSADCSAIFVARIRNRSKPDRILTCKNQAVTPVNQG